MQGVTKRNSLYFQLMILLVISGAVALAVFYGLNTVGENVVYYYYNHSNYSAKREKNYVAELQSYVSSNELKSSDTDELSQWVTEKAVIISLWLYKDNALIFDSDYPDNATYSSEPAYLDENNGSRFYTIEFADGEVEVGISGVFDYQLYNYASFGEMLLAFSIFILMVLIGIRKKMEYIRKLSKEIQILEGGNLEYKITVTGKDELTALAGGLNCMRESFRRQTIQEAEIVRENQKIVTQMSHDIRTPLTSIINYADLIGREECANPRITEYAEVLLRQSERLKKLLENLIEASKATTGNLEVSLENCEVGVLLTQAVGEYQQRMEERGLILKTRQPEEPVFIWADGRHIWRIFENLLNNICKYAQQNSRVYLSVEKKEKTAEIVFRNMSAYALEDMTPEELEERFTRGDKSRHLEGNGLGLSIAQSLTQLQGGTMKISIDGDLFKVILEFPIKGIDK